MHYQQLALIDNHWGSIEKLEVPIWDRGFLFTDSTYELIRVYQGTPRALDWHIQRLHQGINRLSFKLDPEVKLHDLVYQGIKESSLKEAIIYLHITKDATKRSHHFSKNRRSIIHGYIQSFRKPSYIPPAKLISISDDCWSQKNLNSVHLLPSILASQKAVDSNCDEAIFTHAKTQAIQEGSHTNFFMVKNGFLITHPTDGKILPGITRRIIIDIAKEMSIPTSERYFNKNELREAQECFICSTTAEIRPVKTFDEINFTDNHPITNKLIQSYQERMTDSVY